VVLITLVAKASNYSKKEKEKEEEAMMNA